MNTKTAKTEDTIKPLCKCLSIEEKVFKKWLKRKATKTRKRDKESGKDVSSLADYKKAILGAINQTGGKDYYTGEKLDWILISKYNNTESKQGKREYKRKHANLPTVDHRNYDKLEELDLVICS